jgi:hypothetical protein
MGVVEVDPSEERMPRAGLAEPGERRVHHLLAGTILRQALGNRLRQGSFERIIVRVEALSEAELRVQHVRGDERTRPVVRRAENLRERDGRRGERATAIDPNAVLRRLEPREQGRMRGQRQRTAAVSLGEEDAVAREPVERRCVCHRMSVCAEMIGACGVECDDHHVRPGAPGGVRRERSENDK